MSREVAKYQTFCNEILGVRIYIKPCNYNRKYKIVVNTKGIEKIGEKEYEPDPKGEQENWSNQIRNLYQRYYELNFNRSGTRKAKE
jgi:hypothetical protein